MDSERSHTQRIGKALVRTWCEASENWLYSYTIYTILYAILGGCMGLFKWHTLLLKLCMFELYIKISELYIKPLQSCTMFDVFSRCSISILFK